LPPIDHERVMSLIERRSDRANAVKYRAALADFRQNVVGS